MLGWDSSEGETDFILKRWVEGRTRDLRGFGGWSWVRENCSEDAKARNWRVGHFVGPGRGK